VDANNKLSASTLRVDADSHILLFYFYFFNKNIVINICMLYINWVIYICMSKIYIFEGVKGYI
jgi:hypothetical protein